MTVPVLEPWWSALHLPEVIVDDLTDGHNAQHELLHAIANLGPVGGVFPVGAPSSGSGTGKDSAALEDAVGACRGTDKGGVVILSPGHYKAGDLGIGLPEYVGTGGQTVTLRGAGPGATTLDFDVEQGPDAWGIYGDGDSDGLYFNVVEGMSIIGPGTRGALGTSPADMGGIRLDSRMNLERVAISGFGRGVAFNGNHCSLVRVDIQDCYYLLFFLPSPTNGDIDLDNCLLTGPLMASIGIDPGATATFHMRKGHIGFGPYGILIEAGAGAGLSGGGIELIGTSVEAIGNAFIHSEDQNARFHGFLAERCGNFSRAFDAYGLSSRTTNPQIYLAELLDADFRGGMPLVQRYDVGGVTVLSDGSVIDVRDTLTMKSDTWKASMDSAIAASQPWIKAPASSLATEAHLNERDVLKAFPAQCFTAAGITAGQVLEWDILNRVRPWGYYFGSTGLRGQLAGIALNSVAAGSREQVIVVTRGRNIPILVDGAAANSYVLVPSTTTVGKATGVAYTGTSTSAGGLPIIGSTYAGTAVPTSPATVGWQVDI